MWQAPPGWPTPPPGWYPPVGWEPDPSWPPAPAGWRWWRRARRSPLQRAVLGLLIGVPAAGFALLLAAQAADDYAGCGSVDPTDPANYSSVSIINDTPNPVVVDSCVGGYCHPQNLPQRLPPGGRFSDDAGCGVSGGDMTSWRVRTANGRLLGYIAVDSPRSEQGLVFDVSQATPDRRTPTRSRS